MNTDSEQLVQRVLAGEREGFEEFFETYFSRLCRFAQVRMSQDSAVEDVVQETLVKALRGLASYRGEAQLFSWLCQICRNEITNWYRRQGRAEEPLQSLDDDPNVQAILESMAQTADDIANNLSVTRSVQLTLDYLPDRYGNVLEWKYIEGLSVDEIATRLEIGTVAAQSILARARQAFREGFRNLQQELSAT